MIVQIAIRDFEGPHSMVHSLLLGAPAGAPPLAAKHRGRRKTYPRMMQARMIRHTVKC